MGGVSTRQHKPEEADRQTARKAEAGQNCHSERLVVFSRKRRGFCPSCGQLTLRCLGLSTRSFSHPPDDDELAAYASDRGIESP